MIAKQCTEMAVIAPEQTMCNESANANSNDMPTNLSMSKTEREPEIVKQNNVKAEDAVPAQLPPPPSETKIHLSFSVDRLLNCADSESATATQVVQQQNDVRLSDKCCDKVFQCCAYAECYVGQTHDMQQQQQQNMSNYLAHGYQQGLGELAKSVVRPTPIRAMGNACDNGYNTLAATTLLRYHQHQQQQHKHHATTMGTIPLLAPLGAYKTQHPLSANQAAQHYTTASTNRLAAKAHCLLELPTGVSQHVHHTHTSLSNGNAAVTAGNNVASSSVSGSGGASGGNMHNGKRKRSWSRAVFSNLQRKGLEIQFQQQKYITKPDRRRLAARLNLTDAQVKVWFQNRRMKWRHTRENLKSGQEKQTASSGSQTTTAPTADTGKSHELNEAGDLAGYSTDASSSVDMSEHDEDDEMGEIDVVE